MSLSMSGRSGRGPTAIIVTPGTREANNGNWRTAQRWAGFLAGFCTPIVQTEWLGEPADLVIALHALRSAASIRRLKRSRPDIPLAVVLSGTDLYRDLPRSRETARSLDLADRIVLLQEDALAHLPRRWHGKCEVIVQSSRPLKHARPPPGRLDVVAVGHLRPEKDPTTLQRAIGLLDPALPVRVRHVGAALDPALAKLARAAMRAEPRYRWLGALPHGLARIATRNAHLLVHPSIMEGGANVIAEAIMAGTPVLASRMSGNLGMLGPDYPGYFEVGDAAGLARGLVRCLEEPGYLRRLRAACAARRPLFAPARERRAVRGLLRLKAAAQR